MSLHVEFGDCSVLCSCIMTIVIPTHLKPELIYVVREILMLIDARITYSQYVISNYFFVDLVHEVSIVLVNISWLLCCMRVIGSRNCIIFEGG